MRRDLGVVMTVALASALGCGGEDANAEHSATGADLERPDPIDCAQTEAADGLRWLGGASAAGTRGLRDVAVSGGEAWTCADAGGLVTWDVTGPEPVVASGALDGTPCRSVAVDDRSSTRRIALSDGDTVEMWGVDGTLLFTWDAEAPVSRVRFADGGSGEAGGEDDGDGSRLLVSNTTAGMVVLAADGTVEASHAPAQADTRAVLAGDDGLFYVADGRGGLGVFEQDGDTLTERGRLDLDPVLDLRWADGRVLATTLESVVWIDVDDPGAPRIDAEVETPGSAVAAAMLGDKAVVADFTEIVQARAGETPAVVNVEPLIGEDALDRTRALAVDEQSGRVYVAQWDSLQVFDNSCDGPAGALRPGLRTIDFGVVEPGRTRTLAVTISNEGDAPLRVNAVTTELAGFSTDFAAVTLEPGATSAFEVGFEAPDSTAFRGSLVIESDDPDQPQFLVPMSANVRGVRVGEPLVPFRNIDVRGQVWDAESIAGQVLLLAYFADW